MGWPGSGGAHLPPRLLPPLLLRHGQGLWRLAGHRTAPGPWRPGRSGRRGHVGLPQAGLEHGRRHRLSPYPRPAPRRHGDLVWWRCPGDRWHPPSEATAHLARRGHRHVRRPGAPGSPATSLPGGALCPALERRPGPPQHLPGTDDAGLQATGLLHQPRFPALSHPEHRDRPPARPSFRPAAPVPGPADLAPGCRIGQEPPQQFRRRRECLVCEPLWGDRPPPPRRHRLRGQPRRHDL